MKYKKSIVFTVCFLFALGAISFFGGVYFQINSRDKIIFQKSFDSMMRTINKYVLPSGDLFIGDNFTVDSSIHFSLDSEYYSRQSTLEDIKKYHIIQNLNQLDTRFSFMQNENDKKLFAQFSQQIGSEVISNIQYLIDNATEYYFVNQFMDYYINNGTCNYFETLNDSNTTKDNIDYLYYFILNSIRNNLMKEEFFHYKVNQFIGEKKENLHLISIHLTDSSIHNTLNGVLNDLKKDKKAYFILKSTYKDFSKTKIKKSVHFLDKEEIYTLNIYTSSFLYKPLKYEVIHKKKEKTETFYCEINHSSFHIFYQDYYNHIYHIIPTFDDDNIKGKILDSKDKKIGDFSFERDKNDLDVHLSFDDDYLKYDFSYSSKILDFRENKTYRRDRNLSFKIIRDKIGLLNGDVVITSKIENKVKKVEDVTSTKLSSKLSDSEKEQLRTWKSVIMTRLEK